MVAKTRKGARTIKDIPDDVLEDLNEGLIESVNLMEWLAVDQKYLLRQTLTKHGRMQYFPQIDIALKQAKKPTITSINKIIGESLILQAIANDDEEWVLNLLLHPADSVRCWVCFSIAYHPNWTLKEKFEHIYTPAQDYHFGVREVAWMAMRQHIIDHLDESLNILEEWVVDANENVRRFASEATRPRGVWCAHISVLREHPEKALNLLNTLAQDPAKYVQNSVGNWLNDAAKTDPDFVKTLCEEWSKLNNPNTKYIIRRALRNTDK